MKRIIIPVIFVLSTLSAFSATTTSFGSGQWEAGAQIDFDPLSYMGIMYK